MKYLTSLFLAGSLAILAGCGPSSSAPANNSAASAAGTKKSVTVGFAQTGEGNAWRTANTASMKSEAAKRGINLQFADGQAKQENQIAALRSFIAQGVDVIVLPPIVEAGWEPVLREAQKAKIPVIITDRAVKVSDPSLYACFIGSDFKKEGEMVAEWLAKHTGGKGRILELVGTVGSSPAIDRHNAFVDAIKKYPDLKIIDSQTGDFSRDKGKQVMEAFLNKYGHNFDIVYSHNDDMALGAIQAIEEAGLKPGKDVMIVSIDAIKEGVQAVADGKMNLTVECNPLFGPSVYDTVAKILAGEKVPAVTYNHDDEFDSTNAAAALPTRQY